MQRIALDAPEDSLSDPTLEALAGIAVSLASSSRCLVGLGAGVSTSAGIPDFRTPRPSPSSRPGSPTSPHTATPLPAQATKRLFSYSALLHPDSRAAHLRFMAQLRRVVRRAGPAPAASRKGKERAEPAPATAFHSLLCGIAEGGRLLRVYTQNIDGLERRAGLGMVDLASAAAAAASDEGESDGSDWGAGPSPPSLRLRPRGGEEQKEADHGEGVVVPLHGGLEEVVCGACGWREKWRSRHSKAFRKGRTVECGRSDSRHRRSKRAIPLPPLAFLRPAVLLYDDPHSSASSAASLIASLAASDLTHEPDFFLVAGTSLRIPGFKKLVRRFAAGVRRNGGLCVLVNREAVGKEWESVFDYYVLSLAAADALTLPFPLA
ncbi:NAD-dependent deacetylase hst3 [Rhodotorula kratochvilovae]